jgi:hypothetical protein
MFDRFANVDHHRLAVLEHFVRSVNVDFEYVVGHRQAPDRNFRRAGRWWRDNISNT